MSSSFWYGDFYFNEEYSKNYKVCLIDFNSRDIVKYIGGSHTISIDKETSYNGQHFYKETERISDDMVLQLVKTDGSSWTVSDILDINGWLFTENFCKFQPMDFQNQGYNIVYYLKAIDIKKNFTPNMEGILEVTFKSYDGYVYIIPSNTTSVEGGSSKIITNMSNISKIYLPKIKVVNHGDEETTIKIKNLTNGNVLTLKGLENGEIITIDCSIGSILNSNNINRFSVLQDYDFIGLNKGKNTIQVTGNSVVEFICEYPVIL